MFRLSKTALTLTLVTAACSGGDDDDSLALNQSIDVDALHVAADGTVYAAEGFRGSRIFQISDSGAVSVVAEGLSGPIDVASAPDGRLYVTNFRSATVSRVDVDGTVTTLANVQPFPSGIARAPNGDLFVSHYGATENGLGTGRVILRITEDGDVSTFSSGDKLRAPVGIALGDDGTVYTGNFHDGRIIAIDAAGVQTEIVDTADNDTRFNIGHLEIANGLIYATAISANALVRVDPTDGTTSERAPGTASPNGIAFDPVQGRLLVARGLTSTNVLAVVTP